MKCLPVLKDEDSFMYGKNHWAELRHIIAGILNLDIIERENIIIGVHGGSMYWSNRSVYNYVSNDFKLHWCLDTRNHKVVTNQWSGRPGFNPGSSHTKDSQMAIDTAFS